MNLCRGLIKAREGAKISRMSWGEDRLTFLVHRTPLTDDPDEHLLDKYSKGVLVKENWLPSTEELFADDWKVLRGV